MAQAKQKSTAKKKGKGLGRGLSSLLGDAPAAVSGEPQTPAPGGTNADGLRSLPIEYLQPGKYQPRHSMDDAAIEDLAASIREKGVLQPILVRGLGDETGDAERFEIIAGERRWRASQLAQLHRVPVLVRDLSDQEALEIGLIENLQREDLSPLEEAEAYRRLMDEFEHTQEVLSKHVGKSRSHVANMMRLLGLPDQVKVMIDERALSAGHARALLAADDPVAMARLVAKKGLNVRQTEKLVQKGQGGSAGAARTSGKRGAEKDADTRALEADLTRLLGLNVEITFKGQGGVLALEYGTLEQLDDLLHRLTHGGLGTEPEVPDDSIDALLNDDMGAEDLVLDEPEPSLVNAGSLTFSESEMEAIAADIAEEESLADLPAESALIDGDNFVDLPDEISDKPKVDADEDLVADSETTDNDEAAAAPTP